ncbi:unnamed protein product, partial [Brenthis ino]
MAFSRLYFITTGLPLPRSATIESFQAATDGAIELPCDVTPALHGDSMGLVIWYKQGHDAPIYTFDIRDGVTSHWSDPSTLATRATFRPHTTPAVLLITKLRPEDSGQYRCRVDFIRSPTKNTRLNLTILIPPERLVILDQTGEEIAGSALGPYDEGTEVNITCIAVGGRPPARVSWWKAHALLANSEARATVSLTLQRVDLATIVTCQAVTDPSITPLSKTLSIDVNLPPLWVKLQGGPRILVAEKTTELVCTAVGARPTPTISWWKSGTRLTSIKDIQTSVDGNITRSTLSFVPSIEDAGRMLSCKANQPAFPHNTYEDGFKLEIQHLPVVKLELGANLNAENVIEGSDVYLDCMVRANPWHTHVYFTHKGSRIRGSSGIVVANQSLVLQHVSRVAAGPYICVARNALGEGSSAALDLNVKYSPACKTAKTASLYVARGETVQIDCELDSNPMDPMTYQWWFNNTSHSKLELHSEANTQNNRGRYQYTVNSSADYGWVQCAGTNSVGRQLAPCLFHILPAEKPSQLKHCAVTNITHESLWLECSPGHDGGLHQSFLLQVYDVATGSLLRNLTSEDPQFVIWGLSGAVGLSVRAFNQKGLSEPFTITTSLLKYPQRQTANIPVKVELTTVLIIVLCTVAGIAAITTVSAIVFCFKYCNRSNDTDKKNKRKQDEISNTPLTGGKRSESVDSLEKNPDIIPIESKISENYSKKDYCMKPLIQKMDDQYKTSRPMYGQGLAVRMPSMQGLGLASDYGHDKVYESWLKYNNSIPLNSGMLQMERTSDIYPMYGNIPSNIEPSSLTHCRSPVNIDMRNSSAHFRNIRGCSTLPHRKSVSSQVEVKPMKPLQITSDTTYR